MQILFERLNHFTIRLLMDFLLRKCEFCLIDLNVVYSFDHRISRTQDRGPLWSFPYLFEDLVYQL